MMEFLRNLNVLSLYRERNNRDSTTTKDKMCKKQSATNTFLRQEEEEVGNVTSGQSEGLSSVLLQLIYLCTCL